MATEREYQKRLRFQLVLSNLALDVYCPSCQCLVAYYNVVHGNNAHNTHHLAVYDEIEKFQASLNDYVLRQNLNAWPYVWQAQ